MADKDWGADFRRLSAGAALVALTLWLDHMQAILLSRYLHLRFISHINLLTIILIFTNEPLLSSAISGCIT